MNDRREEIGYLVRRHLGAHIRGRALAAAGPSRSFSELELDIREAVVERLTRGPVPSLRHPSLDVEIELEGGDPRGKVISVSFQLDALFLADLGNLEGVEESEAGGEDGLLGEGGVDEVAAPTAVAARGAVVAPGPTVALEPVHAPAALAAPHHAEEWVLLAGGLVLLRGPFDRLLEEMERLLRYQRFPLADRYDFTLVRASAVEPRVGELPLEVAAVDA